MKRGYLGLPIPQQPLPGQSIIFEAIPTHIYTKSASELAQSKVTRQKVLADSRFQKINGGMLNTGSGGRALNADNLIAWWTYRANEVGIEIADNELNRFLDTSTIDLLAVLWVYGITTKKSVRLSDGVELVPIGEMPFSQETFDFQRLGFTHSPHELPAPQAALTKKVTVPKLADASPANDSTSFIVQSKLHKISFLMNSISGACCVPGYQTFYNFPEDPLGPFGGSGGGAILFDMLPRKRSEFDSDYADLLSNLAFKYDELNDSSKTRIESALLRLAQAKGRLNPGDVCLDLGIALEMMLLNTEHENQELPGQLNLHFRLRGSWLVGKNKEDRRELYRTLGKIYSFRSKIAHNGFSNELFRMPYGEREAMLSNHIAIGEKILQHLILNGTPSDWASLILGN